MNNDQSLSDWQRGKLCEVILLGCDRETAGNYIGATPAQVQAELDRDEAFAREVMRTEAEAEMRHMGNVHKASLDEKNWRSSVWWLERRAQQRAHGAPIELTDAHVAELVDKLALVVVATVVDAAMQRQLIEGLYQALDRGPDAADAPPALPGPDAADAQPLLPGPDAADATLQLPSPDQPAAPEEAAA